MIEADGSALDEQSRDPDARAGGEGLEAPSISTGRCTPIIARRIS